MDPVWRSVPRDRIGWFSCGHTVGLNGVLWVYGFMGARWNWCGINNINLSQAGGRGECREARNIVEGFAKKTIRPFVRPKLALSFKLQ